MKIRITNYSFNPATRQLTFNDYTNTLDLDSILLITNTTDGIIIYNFTDPNLLGTISGNVLTLAYNTTSMSATDELSVFYDDKEKDITDDHDTFGTQPLHDGRGNLKISTGKYVESGNVFYNFTVAQQELGIDCKGYATVIIDISGTFVGTISFERLIPDSGVWLVAEGTVLNGVGVPTTSLSGAGHIAIPVIGSTRIRCRMTAWTSGLATVVMKATTAPFLPQNVANYAQGTTTTADNQIPILFGATGVSPTALNASALVRPAQEPIPIVPLIPSLPTTYPNNFLAGRQPQYYGRLRVEAGGDQKLPFAQESNNNRLIVSDEEAFPFFEAIFLELRALNCMVMNAFNASPPDWYRPDI